MMWKELFSISLAALLLAVIAFAALETWLEIHARESRQEITRLEEPGRPFSRPHGAEASPNH